MKTFQTTALDENQVSELLFRQLFIFQSQLESGTYTSYEQQEVEEIIYLIDELLAVMIDCYRSEKE
ncbi:MAG: hypothetical protein P8P74_16155 [Crocinitomicaceae bacterium]|nr:hypothetical protein [Crocinitomicaceae bacterium]